MLDHRSKKWWRRLFFHLMMASAHNAYVIAKDSNPEVVSREWPNFQDFIEDLASGLIDDMTTPRAPPMHQEAQGQRRHTFVKLFDKDKVCVECRFAKGQGVRVGTSKFGCQQCNVAIHTQCFPKHVEKYHAAG